MRFVRNKKKLMETRRIKFMKPFFAFAATFALLVSPRLAFAEDGYVFDVTARSTKNGKPLPAVVFKTVVCGPKARIEIPINKDEWKKGDYLLTTDSGRTFSLISPSRKTVTTYDEAIVRAQVEKENKGVSVGDPETRWANVGPDQRQYTRRYEIKFRQGLLSGTGTFDEQHDFTLAPAQASGPAYNPFVTYTLLELGSLLLKNPKFAAAGLSSVLPKGFVREALLTMKTKTKAFPFGGEKEETLVTISSSAPVATDISAVAFVLPADFRIIK